MNHAFENAVYHAMYYEVGGFWKITPDVELGLCSTRAQKLTTGYVNDPDDSGGETKFGISKRANPSVNIKTLTWEQAKEIYYHNYWELGRCDMMHPRVAMLHFDSCINVGVKNASKFLQRAASVEDDGILGPISLAAINACDIKELNSAAAQEREKYYRGIVARKPTQEKYINGWLRRVREVYDYSLMATNLG